MRVYKSIEFEFDDETLLDVQSNGFNFSKDVAYKPAGVEFWSASLTHRHERNLVIPQFGYAWAGDELVLTDDYVINRSVVHLLSWINEQTKQAPLFDRVELKTAILGGESDTQPDIKDVTTEAKVVAAKLALLLTVEPTDFS